MVMAGADGQLMVHVEKIVAKKEHDIAVIEKEMEK